ncbi:hypothetical protein O3M35_005664 [Rhynocoris fuscipes]|uniref:EF-hand domain-containing protein n=1 Tax=Rhynocoris fuscipes TaxID=488301 RepID=A0AAW1DJ21_9HEMI
MSTRKAARSGSIQEVTTDLEKKITECFEIFDHAANKTVDVREIGTIIRSLGCIPTEAEIQEIIVNVEDQENAGTVPLQNFLPHVDGLIKQFKYECDQLLLKNY